MVIRVLLVLIFIGAILGAGFFYRHQIITRLATYQTEQAGQQAMSRESWDEAIGIYEKGLTAYPENLSFQKILAKLYSYKGLTEKAEPLYKQVLTAEPGNVEARIGYATLLSQIPNRLNEGIQQYRDGLKVRRGDSNLLSNLAELYQKAANNPAETRPKVREWLTEWAAYYYQMSLKNEPKVFQNRFNLGMVYMDLKKPEQAAKEYCKAIILNPKSYESHYNLGLALVNLNNYDEGYRQFSKSVNLLSESGQMDSAQQLAEKIQHVKNNVYSFAPDTGLQTKALPAGFSSACLDEKQNQNQVDSHNQKP